MMTYQETYESLKNMADLPYIAVDVETANKSPDSICQIAIAWLDGNKVRSLCYKVKPPTKTFTFTCLHGLTYKDVEDALPFSTLWDEVIYPVLHTSVLVAHYANFDANAIFKSYVSTGGHNTKGLDRFVFRDTCILARRYFPNFPNHKLPTVCNNLHVELSQHHDAAADAQACVNIALVISQNYDISRYDIPFFAVMDKGIYNQFFFGNQIYHTPSTASPADVAKGAGVLLKLIVQGIVYFFAALILLWFVFSSH